MKRARSDVTAKAAAAPPRLPLVFAFDRDQDRLDLLTARITAAGAASTVRATCADFLTVRPDDPTYARVTSVLLDPSCSGSGMRARWGGLEGGEGTAAPAVTVAVLGSGSGGAGAGAGAGAGGGAGAGAGAGLEHETPPHAPPFVYTPPPVAPRDATRVRNLAAFQTLALLHAFSFPAVRRVVFSTCSLYAAEDEDVVAAALKTHNARALPSRTVRLLSALPAWPLRGVPGTALSVEDAEKCVRWDPAAADKLPGGTGAGLGETGFFVALFALGGE